MYYYGRGVQQSDAQALQWYRKAAAQGSAGAEYDIGHMYELGRALPQDYLQAISWYRKAADQNDSRAQCGIGSMYYDGRGVQQNLVEAAHWFRIAADEGFAGAQYDLGYMYYYGQGVQQDRAEADRRYRKAANQGYAGAQRALGLRGPALSTRGLVGLAAIFLGCFWALKSSQLLGREVRNKQQRALDFGAILGLIYIAMSLYADFHAFESVISIGVFDFARNAVVGIVIGLGIAVVWPKGVGLVLSVLGALFAGINVWLIAHHAIGYFATTVRGFWEAEGLLIGISATLAIFLWRSRRDAGQPSLLYP